MTSGGDGAAGAGLFAPVCSIAPTRRRRFLWALWTSGPPARQPFRHPDHWHGGARSRDEARRAAVALAGREVLEIEARWARAWSRVLQGQPAWAGDAPGSNEAARPRRAAMAAGAWPLVLGVAPSATEAEIKRAYRKRALETHPDHGGDADDFRRVQHAYEQAVAPRRSRRRAR
jgi:hypothetical protein